MNFMLYNHSKNLTIMFQTSKTPPPWITQLYIPLEFEFMTYSGSLYKLLQTLYLDPPPEHDL